MIGEYVANVSECVVCSIVSDLLLVRAFARTLLLEQFTLVI